VTGTVTGTVTGGVVGFTLFHGVRHLDTLRGIGDVGDVEVLDIGDLVEVLGPVVEPVTLPAHGIHLPVPGALFTPSSLG
jgi:hypothetical protein